MRYLLRSLNMLNLLLLAGLALLGGYLLRPLPAPSISLTAPAAPPAPAAAEEPKTAPAASAFDYLVVSQQNLFHPDRVIPVEKKDEKPLPKPEFVLYGVLIEGETKKAFMEDLKALRSSDGRGRRQQVISLGSSLSGYILKEIQPDRIVMARGEDKIEVMLDDRSQKRTGAAETTAAAVPSAAPSAVPAPTTVPTTSPAVTRPTASPNQQPFRPASPQDFRNRFRSIKNR